MLKRADLPVQTIVNANAHITHTGIWVYAGTSPGGWTVAPIFPAQRRSDPAVFFIKVRDTAGPLTITRSAADNFQTGGVSSATFTLQPGESAIIVSDGSFWLPMTGAETPARNARVVISAVASFTLSRSASVYVHTGTGATWTLPALANNTGLTFTIKNRGSGAVVLQRAGTDNLYDTASVTSVSVAAGGTARVVNDGSFWLVV